MIKAKEKWEFDASNMKLGLNILSDIAVAFL